MPIDFPPAVRERLLLVRSIAKELAIAGKNHVTSRDLSRWLGTTAATVRKDLAWIEPRSTGTAYDVVALADLLDTSLARKTALKTAVAGLGDFGLAIVHDVSKAGGLFDLVTAFDSRTNRLEQLELPIPLYPTTEIVSVSLRLGIEAAIVATGPNEAQKIAERFVQGGVKSIFNFAPTVLRLNRHHIYVRECGLGWDVPPSADPAKSASVAEPRSEQGKSDV